MHLPRPQFNVCRQGNKNAIDPIRLGSPFTSERLPNEKKPAECGPVKNLIAETSAGEGVRITSPLGTNFAREFVSLRHHRHRVPGEPR